MTVVSVSTRLEENTPLWRYMSLDKLVNLLSTNELHFTPLASFVESDPFEGYLPAVAFEADASIFRPHIEDSELAFQLVEEHRRNVGHELTKEERALVPLCANMSETSSPSTITVGRGKKSHFDKHGQDKYFFRCVGSFGA